jgi:hypothetical protein
LLFVPQQSSLDCYIRISQPLPCLEQQQQYLLTSFLDLC